MILSDFAMAANARRKAGSVNPSPQTKMPELSFRLIGSKWFLSPRRRLLGGSLQNGLEHTPGHLREGERFHRIRGATFRERPDGRGVTEHFRQRHMGVEDGLAVLRFNADNRAATT